MLQIKKKKHRVACPSANKQLTEIDLINFKLPKFYFIFPCF